MSKMEKAFWVIGSNFIAWTIGKNIGTSLIQTRLAYTSIMIAVRCVFFLLLDGIKMGKFIKKYPFYHTI